MHYEIEGISFALAIVTYPKCIDPTEPIFIASSAELCLIVEHLYDILIEIIVKIM